MAKAIINKHIDSADGLVLSKQFTSDEEMQKGELLICNDPNNPTIYIMDTTGNPRKIAGGGGSGSSEAYDDTAIWNAVNKNTEAIADLKENPSGNIDEVVETLTKDIDGINETVKTLDGTVTGITETVAGITETVNGVTENLSAVSASIGEVPEGSTLVGMVNDVQGATETNAQAIEDNKTVIDEYTVNSKKISENPVLNTDDILIADTYSTLTKPADNVYPGDIITTAISKLEVMLANTTLALTAAINDLEAKIGVPSSYDEEGNKTGEASGLYAKYEELSKQIEVNQ